MLQSGRGVDATTHLCSTKEKIHPSPRAREERVLPLCTYVCTETKQGREETKTNLFVLERVMPLHELLLIPPLLQEPPRIVRVPDKKHARIWPVEVLRNDQV